MSKVGVAVWASSNNREGSQFQLMLPMDWASAEGWRVNPLRSQTKVSAGNPMSTASLLNRDGVRPDAVVLEVLGNAPDGHRAVKGGLEALGLRSPEQVKGYQLKLKLSA